MAMRTCSPLSGLYVPLQTLLKGFYSTRLDNLVWTGEDLKVRVHHRHSSEWDLTKEIIKLPLSCLQGAQEPASPCVTLPPPSLFVVGTALLPRKTTLETTQGQIDGFFSQLPSKYYLPEVASVGD